MGRFVVIGAFLLGLVGAASGQNALFSAERPEFPADPNGGCTPGKKVTSACPTRMECLSDKNYANGGRCYCNPLWMLYEKTLPFEPGSEWDDSGFSTSDCEGLGFPLFVQGAWLVVQMVIALAFLYTDAVVIKELVRGKAFKWNATGISLVVSFIDMIGLFFICLIYFLQKPGWDTTEFWYANRVLFISYIHYPADIIVDFEIAVTWIDLYDRTKKMSKSSSRNIKLLRFLLRTIAFVLSIGYIMFVSFGGYVNYITSMFGFPAFALVCTATGGILITQTLCPDRKDVANPNWKVTEAIRRGVKHAILSQLFTILLLLGIIFTVRRPLIGHVAIALNTMFWFNKIVKKWAWLQYLIYGSRKHLQRFASDSSSAYFGFSTIGLNKTLTTASSRMSSTMSTRSSAAPSTVEKS